MKLLPDSVNPTTKNSEFDETSAPEGLLHNHQTKANIWVKIVVLEGKLKIKCISLKIKYLSLASISVE